METDRGTGSRVLYATDGSPSLYDDWGPRPDQRWDAYLAAMNAGETLRRTETHALLDGVIELIGYRDPFDGSQRFAVSTAVESGGDWRVVDFRELGPADDEYEREVLDNADPELPYKASDIIDVPISRRSRLPDGLSVAPSGEVGTTEDLAYLGLLPPLVIWPRTPPAAGPPRPVLGMTARPSDWGPRSVDVRDVTPRSWREAAEPPPNALALVASPDGRFLLASADDAGAHVWSTGDGRRLLTVSGHLDRVLSVALTVLADGQVALATGGQDRVARVWGGDGEPVASLTGHRGPVNAVTWAAPPGDVPWVVTGGDDATVRVWDPAAGEIRAVFEVGTPSVDIVWSVAAAVRADGHVCVVAGVDGRPASSTVYVWDATARTVVHEFVVERDEPGMRPPQVAVATLADRSYRVAAAAGGVVRVWDGHTGEVVRTFAAPGPRDGHVALAVLPDLRVAVATTGGRRTLVWDTDSGTLLSTVDHASEAWREPVGLVAQPGGALLLATGRDGDTPARLLRLTPHW